MTDKRKIIVLYASAGHGHEKAAKAVYASLLSRYPDHDIQIYDILKLTVSFFGPNYRKSYLYMIQKMSWWWGFLYFASDINLVYAVVRPLRRLANHVLAKPLRELLLREQPEVVVSAHFMSTEVTSFLKQKKMLSGRLLTIVTDYLPHYFWTAPFVDGYVVAIPECRDELAKRGADTEKIRVIGIPVEKKFSARLSRSELVKKYGLKEGVFTVLLTSGGAGVGAIEQMTERFFALGKPVQVLVVCGTNQSLLEKMRSGALQNEHLKTFGFVDTMEELMEVCDVVVGKGGGLTVTETLCKQKIIIIYQPVPGQESRNAECMEKYHAAVTARSLDDVVEKVGGFLRDPASMKPYQEAAGKLARPDAADVIADWAASL